jgi:hypothetical protein
MCKTGANARSTVKKLAVLAKNLICSAKIFAKADKYGDIRKTLNDFHEIVAKSIFFAKTKIHEIREML